MAARISVKYLPMGFDSSHRQPPAVRRPGHHPRMALADAIKAGAASGKPVRPPNLGVALPQSKRMCLSCRYYRSAGLKGGNCRLYGGYPVKPNQVSDSWRPR